MDCVAKDLIPVEHEEEILVLKSIFNEDFLSIDNEVPQSSFDLIIRFDSLSNKILLIHEESNASSKLSHLPPLTLRITYKPTYPQKEPPLYYILCDYLTYDHLLSLSNSLDSLWKAGEVIVYTWIEFIKDYFDTINNQLILPSIKFSTNDQRFLTNYDEIGSKRVYDQLIEYDRLQNRLEFEQTNHICPICLDEKLGKNFLQFEKCHHFACLSCLNNHANEYLSNIQYNKAMNCYECDSSLFLSEVRQIFSNNKLLLKYQQRLLEQSVDMIWCPRCHHSIIYIPSESLSGNHPSFVECMHCQWTFCRRCQQSWHPQIQCPKDIILQAVIQKRDETGLSKSEIKKLLLEIETIRTIEQCSKPCPSCNVRIEKNGGCQHMNCRACQMHFCWECGWYARAYGPHKCEKKSDILQVSLPSDMNERVERVLNDEKGNRIQSNIAKRAQKCPRENCRQIHLKVGTANTLVCAKCQNTFCFLCGETVYGKFHFSEYGCQANTKIPQMTSD